ncbi:MAG: peptidylprolyl isomerase [Alphaproteobacteria bacterium]
MKRRINKTKKVEAKMKSIKIFLMSAVMLFAVNAQAGVSGAGKGVYPDPAKMIYVKMETKHGDVVMRLFPDVAPRTVAAFVERVKEGFYDGIYFHRVIPGFVAQGGDPTLVGRPAAGYTLPPEFQTRVKHERGTLAMARTNDINSASTQFYIAYTSIPHLDGQYTVFGQVETGMNAVDKINKGDKMLKVYMVNKQ